MKRLVALLLAGCGGFEDIADAACPPQGTAHTYESFGRNFVNRWCYTCHGDPSSYSSRSFATLDAVRANKDRIFANAAASNTSMPPGPDDPPRSERDALAEWLACGAP